MILVVLDITAMIAVKILIKLKILTPVKLMEMPLLIICIVMLLVKIGVSVTLLEGLVNMDQVPPTTKPRNGKT